MTMKKFGKHIFSAYRAYVICLITLALSLSCSHNEDIDVSNTQNDRNIKVLFDLSVESYDPQTRTMTSDWNDGACIYLNLRQGSNTVKATITYNAEGDNWAISHTGTLTDGALAGNAYYFEGETYKSGTTLTLKPETSTYYSSNVECTYSSNVLRISAVLKPQMARVRFNGTPSLTYYISGLKTNFLYDITSGVLNQNTEALNIVPEQDGFSAPIYALFGDASRKMVVEYSNLRFSRIYEHPAMDPARSGCITLPSEVNHDGWEMVVKSRPSISVVNVSGITTARATLSADIVSDGNCSITECGFCYSSTVSPTINDTKVTCTPTSNNIKQTINKLSRNTTYHVRAYAINEMGITYSDDATFTTLEGGNDNYGIEDWGEDEDWNI